MENLDIRIMLHDKNIMHKELAAVLGIRETSLSRLLRKPLSAWQRERILSAIQTLEERYE